MLRLDGVTAFVAGIGSVRSGGEDVSARELIVDGGYSAAAP